MKLENLRQNASESLLFFSSFNLKDAYNEKSFLYSTILFAQNCQYQSQAFVDTDLITLLFVNGKNRSMNLMLLTLNWYSFSKLLIL